jgi:hypothetical protein
VKEFATVIYNNYLVFSSTVVDPNTYVSEDDDCFSIFMMFGYANGTDSIIDISNYFEIKLANLRNISYLCPVIAIIIEIC